MFPVPFWGVGICLAVFIAITVVAVLCQRKRVGAEYISAKEVSSFRMYDRMQMFSKTALFAAILCFFNTVLLDGDQTFENSVIYLCVNFISVLATLIVIYFAFAKRAAEHFDRTNVFVLGAAIWLFAALFNFYRVFDISAVGYIFICTGLCLMYASMRYTSNDVKKAMSLIGEIDDAKFEKFGAYTDAKAMLYAETTILSLMLVFSWTPSLSRFFSYAVLLLPGVFLVIASIFALLQPLDERSLDKLVVYQTAVGQQKESEAIKNSLSQRLIKEKDRVGIRILTWLVRPFFPCKCVGKEKVKNLDGPVIFVANHYEIYGPVVSILRMPVNFRPWIISNMLDGDKIEAQIKVGLDMHCKIFPKRFKSWLPKKVKKITLYILESYRPIPVYRGNLREVVQTINMTTDAMREGDNIMLFPENPETTFSQGGVDKFYSGFAEIGNAYFKKTGEATTFFPVYISKKRRRLYIGDGIKFDPSNAKADEKRRIASLLHDSMQTMAKDSVKKS